jgi:hypothetical protein
MKNINIPKPCSEDWNEMTPNEKGAFCQKCAKDVYDFTGKSPDEIRQVLTLNMANPVCMRIQPKQLDQLNDDFSAWKIQNKRSYERAWIFTLLVVFGMTLFSCEEDEEPVLKEFQKIGQEILNNQDEKGSGANAALNVENLTAQNHSESVELDECGINENLFVLGEMAIVEQTEMPEKVDTIQEVQVVGTIVKSETYMTAGLPIMTHDYNDYLIQTQTFSVTDTLKIEAPLKITGLAYPNPASNQTTISVNMPKSGKTQIELFALNGQKIRTIHSGRVKKGESEYPIDISNLETGMYLVVINSGKLKETIKFSKI